MKIDCKFSKEKWTPKRVVDSGMFYDILQNMQIPVIVYNSDNEIESINYSAKKLLLDDMECSIKCNSDSCKKRIYTLVRDELQTLQDSNKTERTFNLNIKTKYGNRSIFAHMKRAFFNDDTKEWTILTFEEIRVQDCQSEEKGNNFHIVEAISYISSDAAINTDIETVINKALEDIGKGTKATRIALGMGDPGKDSIEIIYEYGKDKIEFRKHHCADVIAMFPWCSKKSYEDEILKINDIDNMPAEAEKDKQLIQSLGINSLLILPFGKAQNIRGVIAIGYEEANKEWSSDEVHYINCIIESLANLFKNKYLEKQLMENENKTMQLFDNVRDMVFLHKVDGSFMMVNNRAIELLGYSKEELLQMEPKDIVVQEEVEEALQNIRYNVNKEKRIFFRTIVSKSGEKIPVETSAHTFTLNNQEVIIAVCRDIREDKLREEEIHKFQKIIEQSSSMVVIKDENRRIKYVNQDFCDVTGYTLDEVQGKHYSIFEYEERDLNKTNEHWKNMEYIENWKGELKRRKKNGEPYWTLSSYFPIKNNEGKTVNLVGIHHDITSRKQMEETLKAKNRELNDALEQLHFTQMQLINQEKMAGIGQLAAGVAHEINNPLGYIMSNFETLRKYIKKYQEMIEGHKRLISEINGQLPDGLESKVDNVNKLEEKLNLSFINEDLEELFDDSFYGLKRINKIVRNLKIFSHNDPEDKLEDCDLNTNIENILMVAENNIKYHAEVIKELGDIPVIQGNFGQINQVLLNIVINAAQAIAEKKAEEFGLIKVRTYHDSEYVYCEIEDTGVGIPEKNIKNIFNPFFTTKKIGEGTGLGLSIAYDIIKNKHRGEMMVSSKEGIGTKFTIKFPINNDISLS